MVVDSRFLSKFHPGSTIILTLVLYSLSYDFDFIGLWGKVKQLGMGLVRTFSRKDVKLLVNNILTEHQHCGVPLDRCHLTQ